MQTQIPYKGTLSSNQLDALREVLAVSERGLPLVFKGRRNILNQIHTHIDRVKRFPINDTYTRVIQGAPGSGKTTLLNELKKPYLQTDSGVTVIDINGKDLKSERQLLRVVLGAVNEKASNLTTRSTEKRGGSINVFGIKGDLSDERERASQIDTLQVRTIWSLLEEVLGKDNVILLCVDEAQTIKDHTASSNDLLIDFHTGRTERLRIVPIFAGLNDTQTILSGLGVSRLSANLKFQLSSLSQREAEDVVLETLNHPSLGLVGSFEEHDLELMATSLGLASDRWPRHLHHYIHGLLQEVLNDQELDLSTNHVNPDRALEYGHDARVSYYRERASLVDRLFLESLISALQENPNELTIKQLEDTYQNQFGGNYEKFNTAYESAIHFGLIEPREVNAKAIEVPIPSLKTYLNCDESEEDTKSILRQQHQTQMEKEVERHRQLNR